jgi:hypothetical protein
MEGRYVLILDLLRNEANVIGQPEEVFLVSLRACLTCHRKFTGLIVIAERAQTLDSQKVLISDAIEEDDTTIDLEPVSSLRDVRGSHVSRRARGKYGNARHHQ